MHDTTIYHVKNNPFSLVFHILNMSLGLMHIMGEENIIHRLDIQNDCKF